MRLKTNPICAVLLYFLATASFTRLKGAFRIGDRKLFRNTMIDNSVFLPLTDRDEERVAILLRGNEITETFNFSAGLRAFRN